MHTLKLTKALQLPIPELRGNIGSIMYPAFGEIKYDGEFTHICYDTNKICTVNKYNKIRSNFPALTDIFNQLQASKCKSAILLAELYFGDGKRNDLYNLNSNKESDDLKLHVFDIYELDGNYLSEDLIDRKELLHTLLPNIYTTKVINSKAEAEKFFDLVVQMGYEGVVIKPFMGKLVSGPCSWVKMKMKDQNDYAVCIVDPVLEKITVGVPNGQGNIIYVGCKAPMRYKRHIAVGDVVTIEHQGVLDSGSLRHPVLIPKKEWK